MKFVIFTLAMGAVLLQVGGCEDATTRTAQEIYADASRSSVMVEIIDAQGRRVASGSGVVVAKDTIVTNFHVVETAQADPSTRVIIQTATGMRQQVTVGAHDQRRDLALLGAIGLGLPPAKLGTTRGVKIGDSVYAIGSPQGLDFTLTAGLVSQLRSLYGGTVIQTSAAISPGSSGGGLFNSKARLIGVTTGKLVGEGTEGLGFAFPVEWIVELSPQLRHTNQAWLPSILLALVLLVAVVLWRPMARFLSARLSSHEEQALASVQTVPRESIVEAGTMQSAKQVKYPRVTNDKKIQAGVVETEMTRTPATLVSAEAVTRAKEAIGARTRGSSSAKTASVGALVLLVVTVALIFVWDYHRPARDTVSPPAPAQPIASNTDSHVEEARATPTPNSINGNTTISAEIRSGDAEFKRNYAKAINDALEKKNYRHAVLTARAWTEVEPRNYRAWLFELVACLEAGLNSDAYVAAERAYQLAPNDPDVLAHVGRVKLVYHNVDGAIAYFKLALAMRPDLVWVQEWLKHAESIKERERRARLEAEKRQEEDRKAAEQARRKSESTRRTVREQRDWLLREVPSYGAR